MQQFVTFHQLPGVYVLRVGGFDYGGAKLQEPLPTIPIPLKPDHAAILLNLQAVLDGIYDRGRYHARIDYTQPPPTPALTPDAQTWLEAVLKQAGYR